MYENDFKIVCYKKRGLREYTIIFNDGGGYYSFKSIGRTKS